MKVRLSGGVIGISPTAIRKIKHNLASAGIDMVMEEVAPANPKSANHQFVIASPVEKEFIKQAAGVWTIPLVLYGSGVDQAPGGLGIVKCHSIAEVCLFLRGLEAGARFESTPGSESDDSHQMIHAIVENLNDVISYTRPDLTIAYMNKSGMDKLGIEDAADLTKLTPFDIRPPEDTNDNTADLLREVEANGIWRGEKRLVGRGGSPFPASIIVQRHHLGNGERIYSMVARDISVEKSYEKKWSESNQLYEKLAEVSQEFICIISLDGNVLYLNATAKSSNLDGLAVRIGENVYKIIETYTPNLESAINKVTTSMRAVFVDDLLHLKTQNYWIRSWVVPLLNEQGIPFEILIVARNITHEKEYQANLLGTLEKERELNEYQSRFVSMISHEFKTPLSAILSSVELLLNYADKLPKEKKTILGQRIKSSVEVMNQLLEDILLIGKIQEQETRLEWQQINPIEFCSELTEKMVWADECRHPVKFVSKGECGSIRVDPDILRKILENILNNAMKYSPAGSKIIFELECKEEALIFQVADEGLGIPADQMDRIYEPFFRANNRGAIPGTGLGLTIVKKAVDLLNGTVQVQSEVDKGTTVLIEIPIKVGTVIHEPHSGD